MLAEQAQNMTLGEGHFRHATRTKE